MLVFIGVKLVISKAVHVPSIIVASVLVTTLALCVVFSILKDRREAQLEKLEGSLGKKPDIIDNKLQPNPSAVGESGGSPLTP